jgi:predicted RNase H-like HicB family nuclease
MRFIYPAVVSQTEDGRYHAVFPDLETCEAYGDSVDDVLRNAGLAARDWIQVELEEEDPVLPPASDVDLIPVEEGSIVREVLVIYRILEGWDE